MTESNNRSASIGSDPARHYTLVCSSCGRRQTDDGLMLDCPSPHGPALLRTEYADRLFSPRLDHDGLFRYQDWLPVARTNDNAGRTAVYRSKGLAGALGLPNLWIAFNGYWPERGVVLETSTFKEFEAHTVLGRMPDGPLVLTVASSGNTGAAFAWACSQKRRPCLLIVPGKGLQRFRFRDRLDPCVTLVSIDDGDYPDAIGLAAAVSRRPLFQPEGGVKNVARRDGLATVLLSAFEEMRCLPTYYFQAVGSGTGAIAVHEASKRIRNALSGAVLPRLMLCQNLPFTPIYDAWRGGRRSLIDRPAESYREAIGRIYADELANWAPPYEIGGGVHDTLVESRGDVLVTENSHVRTAIDMFMELEGIDVEPAAGVALACLRDAVSSERIDKGSTVLLNITGGGRLRLATDHPLVSAEPRLRLSRRLLDEEDTIQRIVGLCTEEGYVDANSPRQRHQAQLR
jgi:cysteate synthase